MIIKLSKGLYEPFEDIEIEEGSTIEDLYFTKKEDVPYTVYAAKVNNKVVELTFKLTKPCKVEFLDIRTQSANLIFQYSLSLLFLKAAKDVVGKAQVGIMNSLNQGLYIDISTFEEITEEQVEAIEKRMREMVELDLPIKKITVSVEEGIAMMVDDGFPEKTKLLSDNLNLKSMKFYSIGDYRDFFYGYMAPSTAYLKNFELRKYKKGLLLRFPHRKNPDTIPEYEDQIMLYDAFKKQSKWNKILGINFVADLNQKIEDGLSRDIIQLSEALHEKRIAEIADIIAEEKKRIVLIAGPSSSGKTTFARRLIIQLRVNGLDPIYLGTDDYFVEREDTPLDERGEPDYEILDALDIKLFNDQMNGLLNGEEVDLCSFDFIKGKKEFGKRKLKMNKDQIIVIEGIHGLNENLTEFIPENDKFRIYISPLTQMNIDLHNRIPTTDERMLRRLVRDYKYRDHSAQKTIREWPKVRAGEDDNIFPYSGKADVLFNSVHTYEIAVLKKYAEPLLKQITSDEPEYAEAVRMLKFLKYFKTIENDKAIVNNSILREFIGGSIFV
ncbi:MAG: nucleoside kinase [Clostridiales bacterium]|nr:nucleoside kinase [Clostridiales bacterium]